MPLKRRTSALHAADRLLHALAGAGRATGNQILNRLPRPGSLATPKRPPCFLTMPYASERQGLRCAACA